MVKVVKNKHAPPFKVAQFELEFGKGISRDSELVELGCKHKFITKGGGSYYAFDGHNFHGRDAIKRYLAENEGIREELMAKLRQKILFGDADKKLDTERNVPDGDVSGETTVAETDEEIVAEA